MTSAFGSIASAWSSSSSPRALVDADQPLEQVLEHLQALAAGGDAGVEADRLALRQADHLLVGQRDVLETGCRRADSCGGGEEGVEAGRAQAKRRGAAKRLAPTERPGLGGPK